MTQAMNSGRNSVEQMWVNEVAGMRKRVIRWIRLSWIHCRKTKCFHLTLSELVCATSQSKIKHNLNKVSFEKRIIIYVLFEPQKLVVDVAKWEIPCDENQKSKITVQLAFTDCRKVFNTGKWM